MTQSPLRTPIPVSLILGFLGTGKTTAILELLRTKPENERWAVLVNEFGEVGIDGALLESEGAFVREVPGGCMCCVAGLPMQIGLNQLIHKARPDRLLIEPTGLGHPGQILATLGSEHYRDILELRPVLCLVDPRRLEEPRVTANIQFLDQVAAADVLVANKTDLCTEAQIARFDRWADGLRPQKALVAHTRHGRLAPEWLEGEAARRPLAAPHAHHHHHGEPAPAAVTDIDQQPWQCHTNEGQGHFSVGWRIHPTTRFDETGLLAFAQSDQFLRCKGVVHTLAGWRALNVAEGVISLSAVEGLPLSRLELICDRPPDVPALDRALQDCVAGPSP
ncbi:MAG: CobW family GTP-binding protein [Marinobacter sp.]